jgi:hypothetical protein
MWRFSRHELSIINKIKYEAMNSNKPQRPQLNIAAAMDSFSPVADSKATEASQFYEDCADNLPYYLTSEKDNEFDWDRCRAYCRVGKSYSQQRFMAYVAEWFGTTVKEMKLQWRNVK